MVNQNYQILNSEHIKYIFNLNNTIINTIYYRVINSTLAFFSCKTTQSSQSTASRSKSLTLPIYLHPYLIVLRIAALVQCISKFCFKTQASFCLRSLFAFAANKFYKDAVGSGAGPWVLHVQGVEKVSDHGTKNLDKRRNSEGKL
jgi:hypothetical protein